MPVMCMLVSLRRDRPSRPFRCLDAQYRRELVRVYLTNVESICRRFCEDRRQRLSWLREEASSFSAWWRSLSAERRKQLTTEKGEAILKVNDSHQTSWQCSCPLAQHVLYHRVPRVLSGSWCGMCAAGCCEAVLQ